MADENKSFLGLINGLIRHDYYGESDMTDAFLKEELYPSYSEDDYIKLTSKSRMLLKVIASSNMDLNQTEAFLTAQTKKRNAAINDAQAKVLLKAWKSHRTRVHESLIEKSTWNNKLKNLKWRIDIRSQSKTNEQVHVPSAIVELQLENRETEDKQTEVIQFEMDESSMSKVLQSLKEIDQQIKAHCE